MRFVHSRAREATTHTTASPIPNMDDPSGETSFAFEVPRRFIAGFVHIPAPEQQNGGNTDGLPGAGQQQSCCEHCNREAQSGGYVTRQG